MAFLSFKEVEDELNDDFDKRLLNRLLIEIEKDLKSLGLTFNGFSTEVRTLEAPTDGLPKQIFPLRFLRNVTSIKIKSYNNLNDEIVLEPTDYRLVEHDEASGIFWRIELIRYQISHPHYLEITGDWGFASGVDSYIKSIIIDYITSYLNAAKRNYQLIESAGTGDSRVTFGKKYINNETESILRFAPFQRLKLMYLPE